MTGDLDNSRPVQPPPLPQRRPGESWNALESGQGGFNLRRQVLTDLRHIGEDRLICFFGQAIPDTSAATKRYAAILISHGASGFPTQVQEAATTWLAEQPALSKVDGDGIPDRERVHTELINAFELPAKVPGGDSQSMTDIPDQRPSSLAPPLPKCVRDENI